MIINKTKKIFFSIGDIDNIFLDEAETADIAAEEAARTAKRKRIVKYSALAAATASIGIAVTYFLFRSRQVNANTVAA